MSVSVPPPGSTRPWPGNDSGEALRRPSRSSSHGSTMTDEAGLRFWTGPHLSPGETSPGPRPDGASRRSCIPYRAPSSSTIATSPGRARPVMMCRGVVVFEVGEQRQPVTVDRVVPDPPRAHLLDHFRPDSRRASACRFPRSPASATLPRLRAGTFAARRSAPRRHLPTTPAFGPPSAR